MSNWLKQLIINPRAIGAISPSSSSLANLMTKSINSDDRILELGPGTGSITRSLIKRLSNPASQLTLVEIDPFMAKTCRAIFPQIELIEDDALRVLKMSDKKYNTIISGIPFAILQKKIRLQLFAEIAKHLKPDGTFIMFQYSVLTRHELKNYFNEVTTKYTPFNLPPAFVFVAKNKIDKLSSINNAQTNTTIDNDQTNRE
ncbi:methyltransferase domain-containing protein [Candidatus Uhrbacteria bacterium]|nr:methyltransferase domain-containing protein [Candidatus Uhrbacteria bacterium]